MFFEQCSYYFLFNYTPQILTEQYLRIYRLSTVHDSKCVT